MPRLVETPIPSWIDSNKRRNTNFINLNYYVDGSVILFIIINLLSKMNWFLLINLNLKFFNMLTTNNCKSKSYHDELKEIPTKAMPSDAMVWKHNLDRNCQVIIQDKKDWEKGPPVRAHSKWFTDDSKTDNGVGTDIYEIQKGLVGYFHQIYDGVPGWDGSNSSMCQRSGKMDRSRKYHQYLLWQPDKT